MATTGRTRKSANGRYRGSARHVVSKGCVRLHRREARHRGSLSECEERERGDRHPGRPTMSKSSLSVRSGSRRAEHHQQHRSVQEAPVGTSWQPPLQRDVEQALSPPPNSPTNTKKPSVPSRVISPTTSPASRDRTLRAIPRRDRQQPHRQPPAGADDEDTGRQADPRREPEPPERAECDGAARWSPGPGGVAVSIDDHRTVKTTPKATSATHAAMTAISSAPAWSSRRLRPSWARPTPRARG